MAIVAICGGLWRSIEARAGVGVTSFFLIWDLLMPIRSLAGPERPRDVLLEPEIKSQSPALDVPALQRPLGWS